mgnify:CR=1 FL=1
MNITGKLYGKLLCLIECHDWIRTRTIEQNGMKPPGYWVKTRGRCQRCAIVEESLGIVFHRPITLKGRAKGRKNELPNPR